MTHRIRGTLLLTLAALIWGTAFVFQRVGMDYIEPFTFMAARNFIGALVLFPVMLLSRKFTLGKPTGGYACAAVKPLIIGGVCCGVVMFIAGALQQIGIVYTSVGKAGFLTALYIVIVPILAIPLGKKPGMNIVISVLAALAGTYLLSVQGAFSISLGDLLIIGCAVFFSVHILVIDYFSPRVDAIALSCLQFFICALISLVCALVFERPTLSALIRCLGPILYTGVMSSGVAFTIQIFGQRSTPPAVASLVMSLESVFAAVAGWLILHQTLTPREISGCILVFAAVVAAQLPQKKRAHDIGGQ